MFNVEVRYGSGNSFTVRTPVMADRLPDAEHYVTRMLDTVFPDIDVVMVHTGDLHYKVYRVDEPIAEVDIVTGGENVPG